MLPAMLTLVQRLEVFELWRESAFASCIYDENDFAFQIYEWELVALLILRLEIVERRCGRHGSVL